MNKKSTITTQEIAKLCDLLDLAMANAEHPEVTKLFELLSIDRSIVLRNQTRLHRVATEKSIARQLPERMQEVSELKSKLGLAESSKATIEQEINDLTQQLAAAEASAPTEESLRVIESVAPRLAQLRNEGDERAREIESVQQQLATAEANLQSSESALDSLSAYELMPLRYKVAGALPATLRNETDERLKKVTHLITQGRAVLGIGKREYQYSKGDRPATGALREFYVGGGVPGRSEVPVLFDESALKPYDTWIMKPLNAEIEKTHAEVRVAIAKLQLEECELRRKQGLGEANPLSKVYADEIREELQVAALI